MLLTLNALCEIVAGKMPTEETQLEVTGCAIDTRQLKAGYLFVALKGERVDGHHFLHQAAQAEAVAALVEYLPDTIPENFYCIQVKNCRQALAQLGKAWREQQSLSLVALTGSNGKTTVKEMLASILNQVAPTLATAGNLNNDLGVPLTLCRLQAEHQYAVIEMGANHVGEIAALSQLAQPQVAMVTLCAPAHLEGFGSIDHVARAKGEIFEQLNPDGIAIINHDDAYADYWRGLLKPSQSVISFGMDTNADVFASDINVNEWQQSFVLHTPLGQTNIELSVLGQHNIMNALAACAAALACGIDLSDIKTGLQTMQAVAGRSNHFVGLNNSHVIDDCYNANPSSFAAGLAVLKQLPAPRYLVIGDMGELGATEVEAHQQLGLQAQQAQVEALFAVGELSRHTVETFGQAGQHFADKDALIQTLLKQLPANASILIKGSRSQQLEVVVEALRLT